MTLIYCTAHSITEPELCISISITYISRALNLLILRNRCIHKKHTHFLYFFLATLSISFRPSRSFRTEDIWNQQAMSPSADSSIRMTSTSNDYAKKQGLLIGDIEDIARRKIFAQVLLLTHLLHIKGIISKKSYHNPRF